MRQLAWIMVLVLTLPTGVAWALEDVKSETLQSAAVATGNGTAMDVANYSSVALLVTIADTATVTFEGSEDGSTYASKVCTSISNTSGTLVTSATATGTYQCSVAGLAKFRARVSAWTAGAVTVLARATTATISARGGGSSLTMAEVDASPSVSGVTSITVPNGSLTDNGSGSVTFTPAGSGDVTAAATFGTDNILIRSDGTSKGVQSTGISVSDTTNDITGAGSIGFGSNPGDAGRIRLSNGSGEGLCFEIATPGTDKCLILDTSDQLSFNGTINLSGSTTGSVRVNGATSGSLTWTTSDATGQDITGTVAAQTSGAATVSIPDLAGVNDTFVFLAKSGTLTNKTIDCTTAGNVCTVYKYLQLDLVGVAGGTAGHVWNDDPLSTTCTAASTAGTNQTRAFCTFPDSDGEYGKQLLLSLPTGYVTGSLQFRVSWKTTGTGNLRPRLQTLCYASDAASDTAYSNSTYITAAAGTSGRFNQTAWTTATDTGCDAEETMAIRFSRNRTEASDTLNATADVEFVGVRYAVAQ